MKCPACLNEDTKVVDSRVQDEGLAIRRRRECPKCEFRFSTKEQVEILNLKVEKSDGTVEPYSTEKVANGVKIAIQKRIKDEERLHKLIAAIERDVQIAAKTDTITSKKIGDIVMKHLKKTDKIAYIRFASVYQEFEDLLAFQEEVEKLMKRRGKATSKATKIKK